MPTELKWLEIFCAQHERFLFTKNTTSNIFSIKAVKSTNSGSSHHFLDLQLLWHCCQKAQFTVISTKMSLSLINQYCHFDALHLSRCFTEIPGWSSKEGTPTVNTSPVKCDPATAWRSCYDDCLQQSSPVEAFVFSALHHLQGVSFTTLINEKTR